MSTKITRSVRRLFIFTIICSLLIVAVPISGASSDYIDEYTPTSEKTIISISIDDAARTVYARGLPLAIEYDIPMTFFVATGSVGADETFINLTELNELYASGLFEIGSHTSTHRQLDTLTKQEVVTEMHSSRAQLEAWGFEPTAMAYPYGVSNDTINAVAHQYYQVCRGVTGAYYPAYRNSDRWSSASSENYYATGLATYNITVIKERIDRAIDDNVWQNWYWHTVNENGTIDASTTVLEEVLEYVALKRDQGLIEVRTFTDAYNHFVTGDSYTGEVFIADGQDDCVNLQRFAIDSPELVIKGVSKRNLLQNADFEIYEGGAFDSWTTKAGVTSITRTSSSYHGSYAAKLNVTNATTAYYRYIEQTIDISDLGLVARDKMEWGVYAKNLDNAEVIQIGIAFQDEFHHNVVGGGSGAYQYNLSSDWTYYPSDYHKRGSYLPDGTRFIVIYLNVIDITEGAGYANFIIDASVLCKRQYEETEARYYLDQMAPMSAIGDYTSDVVYSESVVVKINGVTYSNTSLMDNETWSIPLTSQVNYLQVTVGGSGLIKVSVSGELIAVGWNAKFDPQMNIVNSSRFNTTVLIYSDFAVRSMVNATYVIMPEVVATIGILTVEPEHLTAISILPTDRMYEFRMASDGGRVSMSLDVEDPLDRYIWKIGNDTLSTSRTAKLTQCYDHIIEITHTKTGMSETFSVLFAVIIIVGVITFVGAIRLR